MAFNRVFYDVIVFWNEGWRSCLHSSLCVCVCVCFLWLNNIFLRQRGFFYSGECEEELEEKKVRKTAGLVSGVSRVPTLAKVVKVVLSSLLNKHNTSNDSNTTPPRWACLLHIHTDGLFFFFAHAWGGGGPFP